MTVVKLGFAVHFKIILECALIYTAGISNGIGAVEILTHPVYTYVQKVYIQDTN